MRIRFALALLSILMAGCASLDDYWYRAEKKRYTDEAWRACSTLLERRESRDYSDGWKTGHFEVSTGGCELPPPVPPKKYWAARYQSEWGQAAIANWYAGYQDGATTASANGADIWNRLATAPTIPEPSASHSMGIPVGAAVEEMGASQWAAHYQLPIPNFEPGSAPEHTQSMPALPPNFHFASSAMDGRPETLTRSEPFQATSGVQLPVAQLVRGEPNETTDIPPREDGSTSIPEGPPLTPEYLAALLARTGESRGNEASGATHYQNNTRQPNVMNSRDSTRANHSPPLAIFATPPVANQVPFTVGMRRPDVGSPVESSKPQVDRKQEPTNSVVQPAPRTTTPVEPERSNRTTVAKSDKSPTPSNLPRTSKRPKDSPVIGGPVVPYSSSNPNSGEAVVTPADPITISSSP